MYFSKREISKRFCCIIYLIHLGWYPTYYGEPVVLFFQDFLRRRIPGADTDELPNGLGLSNAGNIHQGRRLVRDFGLARHIFGKIETFALVFVCLPALGVST